MLRPQYTRRPFEIMVQQHTHTYTDDKHNYIKEIQPF